VGLVDWLNRSLGRTLDEKVHGAGGVAHQRYPRPLGERSLRVRAALAPEARGAIALRARAAEGESTLQRSTGGEGALTADLGEGKAWAGGVLTVEADARGAAEGATLARLTVEVFQEDPARPGDPSATLETYSLESRYDAEGRARLTLEVELPPSR
jgi:hypothetical protein